MRMDYGDHGGDDDDGGADNDGFDIRCALVFALQADFSRSEILEISPQLLRRSLPPSADAVAVQLQLRQFMRRKSAN